MPRHGRLVGGGGTPPPYHLLNPYTARSIRERELRRKCRYQRNFEERNFQRRFGDAHACDAHRPYARLAGGKQTEDPFLPYVAAALTL